MSMQGHKIQKTLKNIYRIYSNTRRDTDEKIQRIKVRCISFVLNRTQCPYPLNLSISRHWNNQRTRPIFLDCTDNLACVPPLANPRLYSNDRGENRPRLRRRASPGGLTELTKLSSHQKRRTRMRQRGRTLPRPSSSSSSILLSNGRHRNVGTRERSKRR